MALDHRQLYDDKYSKGTQGFNRAFPRQAAFLLRWTGMPEKPLRILDLGGGTGEYSLMLQQMGHDVTLVELSQVAVESARELGVRKALYFDFLEDDMDDEFDVVFVKGFSPLNVDDAALFESRLRQMDTLLAPQGLIIYWGVTDLTGRWTRSGWFNWKPVELRAFFDEVLVVPALRYQSMLPVWSSRLIGKVICLLHALPRTVTVVACRRARNAEKA